MNDMIRLMKKSMVGLVLLGFLGVGFLPVSQAANEPPPEIKGQKIPNFGLRDVKGRMVFLNDFCGDRPTRIGWKAKKMLVVR